MVRNEVHKERMIRFRDKENAWQMNSMLALSSTGPKVMYSSLPIRSLVAYSEVFSAYEGGRWKRRGEQKRRETRRGGSEEERIMRKEDKIVQ